MYETRRVKQDLGASEADAVLAEIMLRQDRGEPVDAASEAAQHPRFAGEIRTYFAACAEIADLVGGAAFSAVQLNYPAASPGFAGQAVPREPEPLPQLANYEILEELARGGMGVIYRAIQFLNPGEKSSTRMVALKMMRDGDLASLADVRRFRREAAAVAQLSHSNIVPIYEVGQQEGQHFFSMELIEGGSLAQRKEDFRLPYFDSRTRLDSDGNFWSPLAVELRQACIATLIATTARAVHYAHQRGLIHRDLKPANILIDVQGQPHVTDFGLAKRLVRTQPTEPESEFPLTQPGEIIGTPTYMAPEQARGEGALTTATDVFSLGAIFYELLTSRPPFRQATPLATLLELLGKEPVPPRTLNPHVPPDLETICLKCLHKDPAARYGTAEALAEDLERWQRGEPIKARAVGRGERAYKWARRHPRLAALGLACLTTGLLGVVALGVSLFLARETLAEREAALYVSHIGLAKYERLHSVFRAQQHLEQCEPSRRRWEWHYLHRLCHSELRTLTGHTGTLMAVAYHPQGKVLATASADGRVLLWEVETGRLLRTFPEQGPRILHLVYSPDGERLATAAEGGTLTLWDANSGTVLAALRGHRHAVTAAAFSPDGKRLASAGEDGTVRLWETYAGPEGRLLAQEADVVAGLSFSPDGESLAFATMQGSLRVLCADTGEDILTDTRRGSRWKGVCYSPDGTKLVTFGSGGQVEIFDARLRKSLVWWQGGSAHWINAAAFTPNGEYLALGGDDGSIQIWDVRTNDARLAFVLRGHGRRVNGLAYSPDGNTLASASTDGTVKIWDAHANPEEAQITGHTNTITGLAFAPGGEWLASASVDQTIRLTCPHTGRLLRMLPEQREEARCLGVTLDGKELLCGGIDGYVRVREAATGAISRMWKAHEDAICGLGLRASGEELCTVGVDGSVRFWVLASGTLVRQFQIPLGKGTLTAAAVSRNGQLLAYASDVSTRPLEILDLNTHEVRPMRTAHHHLVTGLAFDGRDRLASVSYDQTTRLWDTVRGEEVLTLTRQAQPALTLAFSADGTLLATGGLDRVVRILNGQPRE